MSQAVIEHINGKATWTHLPGDRYKVTGLVYNSKKRFARVFENWHFANGINLWRGSKWLIRNGKKHLIVRVTN